MTFKKPLIIAAESAGMLPPQYKKIAKQAHIIVGASAKSGIQGLVYRLAGYNPTAEEVIAAFKLYVQEEARKYEPEFPTRGRQLRRPLLKTFWKQGFSRSLLGAPSPLTPLSRSGAGS
jgi:hypothetical protein